MHDSIHNNILDNPIERRESTGLKRQRGKWFWRIMYGITAFILSIPILWGTGKHFYDSLQVTLSLLVVINVIVFVLVAIRAVSSGSDSVYRERRGKTWELLMLTGVSNWRVVFGKWLGVMRHLLRDFAWLYIVRIGTLFWIVINVNLQNDFSWRELHAYYDSSVRLFDIRFGDHYFVIALILLLIFTIVELMLSSSIGLATAFFKFKAKTSTAIGIVVRVGIAIIIPLIAYLTLANIDNDNISFIVDYNYANENPELMMFTARLTTILADNGVVSVIVLADSHLRNIDNVPSYKPMVVAQYSGIALYLLFTGIALCVAANRAFVRGLSFETGSPQKMKKKRPEFAEGSQTKAALPQQQIATMKSNSTNIFNIDNPEHIRVEIYHYQRRLGRMILRLVGEASPQYIQLSSVAYVEAPAFWKGARFNTASDIECEQFVQEKSIYINDLTKDALRLYVLDGKTTVKILAGTAQILDELPHNL